jgi:hypothetical protein
MQDLKGPGVYFYPIRENRRPSTQGKATTWGVKALTLYPPPRPGSPGYAKGNRDNMVISVGMFIAHSS